MSAFPIAIHLRETRGFAREAEAVRIGVPLPRGQVMEPGSLRAILGGRSLPLQVKPLALWADRSIKWLLIDMLAPVAANSEVTVQLETAAQESAQSPLPATPLRVTRMAQYVQVETGRGRFEIPVAGSVLIAAAKVNGRAVLDSPGVEAKLLGGRGERLQACAESIDIEESGPVRASVLLSGSVRNDGKVLPVRFTARLIFIAGSAAVSIEFKLWNPEPALHPGGLWDLGDPGSWNFRDLSIVCHTTGSAVQWYEQPGSPVRAGHVGDWVLYQDSSGGEQWNSPNHVDRNSRLTVTFRGYKAYEGTGVSRKEVGQGLRATPAVATDGGVAMTVRDFWQSFPKSLRWRTGSLQAGLFPEECAAGFELQGGEQKRHCVFLDFAAASGPRSLAALQSPVEIAIDPQAVEASGAISWFTAASAADDSRYVEYIGQIVSGERSFFARREIIDEYGWRNFGDLYADHEAVHHKGSEPYISHYNNQYDFIYGAALHYLRTGDGRWRELMTDAARHSVDIDIYRTQGDKSAFNGGLFWHTDHYKPAATSTHRTYSKANAGAGGYGGGPANEQDYSSGFLAYYYLTGDTEAAETVRTLADWVCAMDDGARNLFALASEGATGFASSSRDRHFHGPGRGAGNSINTLMDAYAVTGDRRYWFKAEELIRRCIHPRDDVAARELDDPENRWSYLVFLQVLGRYLGLKLDMRELDYMFWYARDSLAHYARWMLANEVPYKDVLHKVELPTETWPAHDVRKSHILHLAARYAVAGEDADSLKEKADFFFKRCLDDLLAFPTSWLTRPLVILCVYGAMASYFGRQASAGLPAGHAYEFGMPAPFVPQRARLVESLKEKFGIARHELGRVVRQQLHRFRRS